MRLRFKLYLAYLSVAAAATAWSLALVHRSPSPPASPVVRDRIAAELAFLDEVHAKGGPADDELLAAGMAAFRVAGGSRDPAWAALALAYFDRALRRQPGNALAQAYRGAALSLVARDYPLQGPWLVIVGPGFARLAYVARAMRQLDAALASAPDEPTVRLVRASTLSGLPALLGTRETALAEFALLDRWSGETSERGEVIRSAGFQAAFRSAYADALQRSGRSEQAAHRRDAGEPARVF